MKVGYIQTSPIFGEKEQNFEEVRSLLKDVHADLLVLPELFATGYAFTSTEEAVSFAEDVEGKTAVFLKEISKMTGAAIVAGFVEKEGDHIYNSSLIVSDGIILDTYRKIHLFNKEKLWFSPGDKPLKVHEINGAKIGVMICFDWMFPEVTRTLALQGMQILAHPSNLVMPYCQKAMVTRCLENRVFAVTSNRIGTEYRGDDNFTFTGASQITGIDGSVLASSPTDQTSVTIVEIDVSLADNKMINEYNDVSKDRRTEFFHL
ncbi:MAG: acyltransferase [Candidatus Magasanikbacteria bacterium CG_4_10_14_0_2_um_filter_41_10]|uniref:Acyltransferase n=1 Tax=Candidatus Magasanikbacteria bacterium CG_4_10_14_0_2_um_filter_41_10 TaxID=1974638 RepID=A0A2M7V5S2_9BACT|nr:MAG: acyltransferase [Candidatus Magasanikbacteria bacterium CG_4_10_14_0_2_um_filter_41_10]